MDEKTIIFALKKELKIPCATLAKIAKCNVDLIENYWIIEMKDTLNQEQLTVLEALKTNIDSMPESNKIAIVNALNHHIKGRKVYEILTCEITSVCDKWSLISTIVERKKMYNSDKVGRLEYETRLMTL